MVKKNGNKRHRLFCEAIFHLLIIQHDWAKSWLWDVDYGMCQALAILWVDTTKLIRQASFLILQLSILMQWSICNLERAAPDRSPDLSVEPCVGVEGWQNETEEDPGARGFFGIFKRPQKEVLQIKKKKGFCCFFDICFRVDLVILECRLCPGLSLGSKCVTQKI